MISVFDRFGLSGIRHTAMCRPCLLPCRCTASPRCLFPRRQGDLERVYEKSHLLSYPIGGDLERTGRRPPTLASAGCTAGGGVIGRCLGLEECPAQAKICRAAASPLAGRQSFSLPRHVFQVWLRARQRLGGSVAGDRRRMPGFNSFPGQDASPPSGCSGRRCPMNAALRKPLRRSMAFGSARAESSLSGSRGMRG